VIPYGESGSPQWHARNGIERVPTNNALDEQPANADAEEKISVGNGQDISLHNYNDHF
jgi:hypothetical protein